MNIAILSGQKKTRELANDPGVTVLASDEFWLRISGIPDFRARLVHCSIILSWLIKSRSGDEVARIKAEARDVFADEDGRLDIEVLASGGVRRAGPSVAGLLDY